tara:strand:+ start:905 stop:1333 length:429 start_codon:yes stop_codon:yes gene_type:complete
MTNKAEYIHATCSFYVAGCLAFLENRKGNFSWEQAGTTRSDFDTFASAEPTTRSTTWSQQGITVAGLNALKEVRNAVVHNNNDLSINNRNRTSRNPTQCEDMVRAANIDGVILTGPLVRLEFEFLAWVRQAVVAVRRYHGEP